MACKFKVKTKEKGLIKVEREVSALLKTELTIYRREDGRCCIAITSLHYDDNGRQTTRRTEDMSMIPKEVVDQIADIIRPNEKEGATRKSRNPLNFFRKGNEA